MKIYLGPYENNKTIYCFILQVEYNRRYPIRGVSPPVPEHDQLPSRQLFGGWAEYSFTDGRIFFYNRKTGEKSWKPPRRRCNTDVCIIVCSTREC